MSADITERARDVTFENDVANKLQDRDLSSVHWSTRSRYACKRERCQSPRKGVGRAST